MSLESELQDTLMSLKPYIDPTKAGLEIDGAAKSFSNLLAESFGLFWLEYISEKLDCGKLPLYSSNKFVSKNQLDALVEHLYRTDNHEALSKLLRFYHPLFENNEDGADSLNEKYVALKKLESSAAVSSKRTVLIACLNCYAIGLSPQNNCSKCHSDNILHIIEISFVPQIGKILSNGQYLEIYTKHCLMEIGIQLIGYPFDNTKKMAFTNVRYQVEGDSMEVDVHGIASPLTLLLCEVKTSAKISSNELRRVEGLYDRLAEKVNVISGRQFPMLKLFVITGEFDRNISKDAYKRKRWELIDRASIANLKSVLGVIKSGL